MASNMNLPRISIISTSYTLDRLKDIIELLESIRAQAYKNIEVLVVTERSLELTNSIETYITQKGYSGIQVLYNEGEWGVSSARNLGISRATGDILAFIDDDALLLPEWAEETAKAYAEDSSSIGLTGPILPLWEDKSMAWFPREFYWIFSCTYWDWTQKTEVRNGYGTNISFRKEAFERCGLFNTNLGIKGHGKGGWEEPGAEETELSLRVRRKTGKRIVYHPNIRVRHKVYRYRFSTPFVTRRAYWEGYSKAMLNKLYRSNDEKILSTEYGLLGRIFCNLIPVLFKRLITQPAIAVRQFRITFLVLTCVAAGYANYSLCNVRFTRRHA